MDLESIITGYPHLVFGVSFMWGAYKRYADPILSTTIAASLPVFMATPEYIVTGIGAAVVGEYLGARASRQR